MLHLKVTPFDELVTPLSKGKVFVLFELTDPALCDEMDCSLAVAQGLRLQLNAIPNILEEFLKHGYMVAESECSEENRRAAFELVDYFRQEKVRHAVRAYLFINLQFIGHSWDGVRRSPEAWDFPRTVRPQTALTQ